jgi:alkylation response protein AidB-like acyl-CoA dehydrogenase
MQKKENFFEDNPDILFHLNHRVDYQTILDLLDDEEKQAVATQSIDDYKNTWIEVLSALGEVVGSEVAPNSAKVEKEDLKLSPNGEVEFGPAMNSNRQKLLEIGASSIGVHPKFGGLGLPFLLEVITIEMIYRACPSTLLNMVWYSSIGNIVQDFGNDAQINEVLPKIASGEWSGSMSLTEPDAGSDLAALRTYGEKQADGTWKLYGTKRFISNGCGEISLVLAKNKKGANTLNDLNLFMVRRHEAGKLNFTISKIEEKVALHGSATCELNFDGSRAELLGKDGEGFRYMLSLMNDARIAVAYQGLGLMEAIWRLAKNYAEQRHTWGKPIAQHELIAEMLLDMEIDTKALRSLLVQGAQYRSLIVLAERAIKEKRVTGDKLHDLEKKLAIWKKRSRNWTPLLKWWVGEKAPHYARLGLQIHGGYGFTKEYRAEWLLRESLILGIYEGTSQIQALMCIKDTLKDVIRRPTDFVEVALGTKVRAMSESNPLRKKLWRCRQLVNGSIVSLLYRLVRANVRASLSENSAKDILKLLKIVSRDLVKFENISPALLHAERITEMKCCVSMAESLCRDAEKDPSRKWIAERFLNKSLARISALKVQIEMDDPVIAQRLNLKDEKVREAAT